MTAKAPVTSEVPVIVMLPVPTFVTLRLLMMASLKRLNWLPTEKSLLSKPTDSVAAVEVELLVTSPVPARDPIRPLLPLRFSTAPLERLNCDFLAPAPEAPNMTWPAVTLVTPV